MANTIKIAGPVIELVAIDSDWLYTATLGEIGRLNLHSIELVPKATGDHCVILDTNAAGATIFDMTCLSIAANYQPLIKYFPEKNSGFAPFLDVSVGAYNAAAKVIIVLAQ